MPIYAKNIFLRPIFRLKYNYLAKMKQTKSIYYLRVLTTLMFTVF